MICTIFDKGKGKNNILRVVSCPASMRDMQAGPGEGIVDGAADDVRQKVLNGRIVDKPANELPPPRPVPDPDDMPAAITRRELRELTKRIEALEGE